MHLFRSVSLCIILVFGLTGFNPPSSPAASITVTTFLDEYADPGPGAGCSLREAITAANTDAAFGGCPAGSFETDIIDLPAGAYGLTIAGADENANATGDLDLTTGTFDIRGSPTVWTIIGANGLDRVFDVRTRTTLRDLFIIGGQTFADEAQAGAGGGIYSTATLNLIHVQVLGNATADGPASGGGGIFNAAGWLSLSEGSSVSNNTVGDGNTIGCGGGIYTQRSGDEGGLDIHYSSILGNACGVTANSFSGIGGDGGGIFSTGYSANISIEYSSINYNHAGDGLSYNSGNGGGISITGMGSNLFVDHSTIAANSAGSSTTGGTGGNGGGIAGTYGTIIGVFSSTISDNAAGSGATSDDGHSSSGGGIYSNGVLDVGTSTIADNWTGRVNCTSSCWGGGIHLDPLGTGTLEMSILSDNKTNYTGPNCSGSYESVLNLIEDPSGCTLTN